MTFLTTITATLAAAVELALQDAESEIASAEESPLRVPSEFTRRRAAMYRRALAAYRATLSRGDEPADLDAHRAASVNAPRGLISDNKNAGAR